MSTAGGGTFGTTVPLGGGYQCQACKQWVTPGITHYCSPNYYTTVPQAPQIVYTFSFIDLATLIKSIEELKDVIKELKDIVDKQQ
jgi:hypothetical protein